MPGLADLIATAGLATDDPDEGSGPAQEGMGRLQHMNGSRCWALAPWDRGRWVAACCAAGAGNSGQRGGEVAGGAGGSRAAIAPAAGGDRPGDRVAALGAGAGGRWAGGVPVVVRADGGVFDSAGAGGA